MEITIDKSKTNNCIKDFVKKRYPLIPSESMAAYTDGSMIKESDLYFTSPFAIF
jgi:hypothetical protein